MNDAIVSIPPSDYVPRPEAFRGRLYVLAGIGAGAGVYVARRLAGLGARTVLLDPSPSLLEETATAIETEGGMAPVLQALDPHGATVADYDALATAIAEISPVLDGLIHDGVHVGYHGPLLTCPPEEWWAVLRTHLDTAFALTRALLPALQAAAHAQVIYGVREEGRRPRAFAGPHAVAHAGLEALVHVANEEFGHRGSPRFATLDPGEVATRLQQGFFLEDPAHPTPSPATVTDAYLALLEGWEGHGAGRYRAIPRD
ncbi:MAG: SDR family oxidoreductase [Candidatus Micrarchaeaceae archaeon]